MISGWRRQLAAATCLTVGLATGCGGGSSSSSGGGSGGGNTQPEHIVITPPASLEAAQTLPFSYSLQETGATAAVTWSITSGALPDGLTLAGQSGVISGTPTTQAFGQSFGVQATDGKASGNASIYIGVTGRLTILPFTASPAHTNVPYYLGLSEQPQGAAANVWSVISGQLPPGLNLANSAGFESISGTPTQVGTYPFTLQVTGGDSVLPQTATADGSITVDSQLTITKATLKNGEQLQPYSDSFTAVNGLAPLTWSVDSPLPPGLTLNAASGQVAGTPSTAGTSISYTYNVTVTDSKSPHETAATSGNVQIATPLQISTAIDPVYINTPYYSQLVAGGGFFPYTWKIVAGNLPTGLSLNATGVISGTTNQLGTYPLTLQVADSGAPPVTATQAFTLHVTPTPVNILGNPISPAPVNVLYHGQVPVSGGTPPYTFSLASGSLPPGLTLDPASGNIDGTPTQIGTFNFSPVATDSSSPPQTGTANDFMQVTKALGRNDSIATATSLGNVSYGNPTFSISPYIDPINAGTPNPDTDYFKLFATPGSPIHVETIAQRGFGIENLDTVIELLNQSGTRLQNCGAPAYNSACLNDDLNGETTDSALDLLLSGPAGTQQTVYLHVLDWRGDARPDMQYYLSISGVVEPLTVSPTTLGLGATRSVSYQQQFTSTGGSGQVNWTLSGGTLPTGWHLSSTGLLSGMATTNGSYTFAITATDSASPPQTKQIQFSLRIADPLTITTSPILPNACVNKPYSFQMLTSGGLPPITFGAGSGTLWVGINVDPQTGLFTGSSPVTGTFMTGAGASDSAQPPSVAGQQISLTVVNCP